jgi:hypothetical protein
MRSPSFTRREPLAEAMALRASLLQHPVYRRVVGAQAVRTFMSHHVFAVWDFMSLLKSLQRRLTCVEVPWIPPIDTDAARLINEIVLCEESDEDGRGHYAGHYDLYLRAMSDVGADSYCMQRYIDALRGGLSVESALAWAEAPDNVRGFVRTTLDIAINGHTHEVAAAFFVGREGVIPEMFDQFRDSMNRADTWMNERLRYYLSRHIEVDGDSHGPKAKMLLTSLCGDDPQKWAEANATACRALHARIALWDGVVREIDLLPRPRRASNA